MSVRLIQPLKILNPLLFVLMIFVLVIFLLGGCTAISQSATAGDHSTAVTTPSATEEETAPIHLKVAVAPYLSYAPFYIAQAEGYYEEEGLDVELVRVTRSSDAIATLAQGELDVAGFPIGSALLNAIVRDSGLKIVAAKERHADNGCTYGGFVVRKGVALSKESTITAELLKSLRYDVTPTLISGYALDLILQQYGLSVDDITIVDMPAGATGLAVMQQGGLDVAAMLEPFITQAQATGAGDLWLTYNDAAPDAQNAIIAYGPTILKDNPKAGERFMVAYLKAVRRFAEGMSEPTLALLAKELDLDPDLLSQMCLPYIPSDGGINTQSIIDFGDWAAAKGLIDAPVTEEMFWEPRFVNYANQVLKDTN